MKLLFALCFSVAMFAAPQDAKPAEKGAKAEAADKPLTAIPASAVQIEQGAYRYTDPKGKKWILFQTPFGIARKEDDGQPLRKKLQDVQNMRGVKIIEDGDSLKFEREGPFGTYKWTKKKSELSDQEQAAWDLQRGAGEKDKTAAATSTGAAKSGASKQDR